MAPPSAAPAPEKSPPAFEYVLLLVLATLWGASFTFMKFAVATIPPITMVGIRGALATMALYIVMRWMGLELPRTWAGWRIYVLQAVMSIVLPFICIAWGLQWVDASLGVILNSTTPIFAFVITWAVTRHEPATLRKLIGLAIGLGGVITIMGAEVLQNLGAQIIPQASLVCGALSYAIAAIYAGQSFKGQHPLVPATATLAMGTLMIVPLSLLLERPWEIAPSASSIVGLLCLSLLSTAAGSVLYFRLLGTIGSFGTTSQAYLRVPIGVLAGVVLLGEHMTWSGLAGLVCVVIGVATMTMPPQAVAAIRSRIEERLGAINYPPSLAIEHGLLLLVATLWAGSYAWVKVGLETIPPLTLMVLRTLSAALFLTAVLTLRGQHLPADRETWGRMSMQGALQVAIPFALIAWGQQWVDAGLTSILNSISPVFAFLITWAITRQEPATARKLTGVVAGFAGVVLVIGPEALSGLGSNFWPQFAILISCASYALSAIHSRHFKSIDPAVTAAGACFAGTLMLLPFALVIEQPWTLAPSGRSLLAGLGAGVFSTALGFLIYFRLTKTLGSIGVTAQGYLRAPIGVLIAVVLLGETLSVFAWLGLALVVVGVAALTIPAPSTDAKAATRPGTT